MNEKTETQPDKETMVAREVLAKGVAKLLDSRGIDLNKVISKKRSVAVQLYYDDRSRSDIPSRLTDFIRECYGGRSVGIRQIEIVFGYQSIYEGLKEVKRVPDGYIDIEVTHLYPKTPEDAEKEKQRVVIPDEQILDLPTTESIFQLERKADYGYVILPQDRLVLSTLICISPFRTPMDYGITSYQLNDWLRREEDSPNELAIMTDPLTSIIDPFNLGLRGGRKRNLLPPEVKAEVVGGNLTPGIVLLITSMIADLPKEKTIRADLSGFQRPTQPRKGIRIS